MRTVIEIPINYSIDEANARLKDFFGTSGYEAVQNGNETVMQGGDRVLRGVWYIAPKVMEGKVVLEGFIGKPGRKEENLDGVRNGLTKGQALNDIGKLQQILGGVSIPTEQNLPPQAQTAQPQPQTAPPQNNQAFVPAAGTVAERNAKFATWSLWIGIAAIVLSLFGTLITWVSVVGICLGFLAVKTSKRKIAIWGIILGFIAFVILILNLILG